MHASAPGANGVALVTLDGAIAELARNSFRAAFLPDPVKARYLDEVDNDV